MAAKLAEKAVNNFLKKKEGKDKTYKIFLPILLQTRVLQII